MDKLLSLNNFVSVENLENEDVEKLIKEQNILRMVGSSSFEQRSIYC